MSNMSYCRFNNTKIDMDDCIEAMQNHIYYGETISHSERESARRMFKSIAWFLCDEEVILEDELEEIKERIDQMIDRIALDDEDE